MIRRRHVFVLVALLTATALVTSSSAFSATAADRDVNVEVAEDPSAYLGFEQTYNNSENATANVSVTVTNRFPTTTELTKVEVAVNGTSVDLAPLAPGERTTHTFQSVSCGDRIGIEASGDGVDVRLERTVDCT